MVADTDRAVVEVAIRYPAVETAERHERILDAASKMFRARGFDGVSVAEVMKAAGLTHGSFPAHFASKEAMVIAGLDRALTDMLALADRAVETSDPKTTFATQYLSAQHRDNPDHGCAMATLGPEIARSSGEVRRVFTTHVAALIERIARGFFPRRRIGGREQAIAAVSTMVGAIMLARAVDDPALSVEILAAGRAQFGVGPKPSHCRLREG